MIPWPRSTWPSPSSNTNSPSSRAGTRCAADAAPGPATSPDVDGGITIGTFTSTDKWRDGTTRVAVCDDSGVFRRRLIVTLEAETDVRVVTECDDANQAIAAARDDAPDVVLIGMQVLPIGAVRACAGIREVAPHAQVLVVLGDEDVPDAIRALRSGATGFLLRDDAVERAARAVRAAAVGRPLLPAPVAVQVLTDYATFQRTGAEAGKLVPPALTDSERACIEGLAGGTTLEAVAEAGGLPLSMAANLVDNAIAKLHRHARSEAVMYTVADRIYSA